MNKTVFYTGISMLVAPFLLGAIIAFIIALINSGINFVALAGILCGVAYVGVALYCIVRGSTENEPGKVITIGLKKK